MSIRPGDLRPEPSRAEVPFGPFTAITHVTGTLIFVILVCGGRAAHAQSADEASVRLNGVPVIEVTGVEGESAAARAGRIERRLERVADRADLLDAPEVVPGPSEESRIVQVRDAPLVTVTRADAEEHLTTVDALAIEWALVLGRALDQARAFATVALAAIR